MAPPEPLPLDQPGLAVERGVLRGAVVAEAHLLQRGQLGAGEPERSAVDHVHRVRPFVGQDPAEGQDPGGAQATDLGRRGFVRPSVVTRVFGVGMVGAIAVETALWLAVLAMVAPAPRARSAMGRA